MKYLNHKITQTVESYEIETTGYYGLKWKETRFRRVFKIQGLSKEFDDLETCKKYINRKKKK